ncbi:hypothetical protein PV08_10260 [Exophiala spinifera]|uniref:HAD hydrolase, family IA n=1 Tax=Exophiala spinifera TaxID=91928 RepID=A0A0D1Y7S0_9EURO|nr:uncharacterized protein PV08_10260 [Exophiala spinifera]KIW10961.1 hypothetical protein PV08_10260 [Exophiala spinifera]
MAETSSSGAAAVGMGVGIGSTTLSERLAPALPPPPPPHPRPVRACIFDLDGLLINSETLLTEARNATLTEDYSRPPMDATVKAKLQGRSAQDSTRILYESARLVLPADGEEEEVSTSSSSTTTTAVVTIEEFQAKLDNRLRKLFSRTELMPGVQKLLGNLARATTATTGGGSGDNKRIELALATSSQVAMYNLKTAHLSGPDGVLSLIPLQHKVLGDDEGLKKGRGKPCPDIFLLALERVNQALRQSRRESKENDNEDGIKPEECLVFEDAVAGVQAARSAGMRVVWVPEKWLRDMYAGREEEVLAGRPTGESMRADGQGGEDVMSMSEAARAKEWGEILSTLEDFDYSKYGIVLGGEQ